MRNLVIDLKVWQDHLAVRVSVKFRGAEHDIWVKVPWKWLAVDDVFERLQEERHRLHRDASDPVQAWLPLEAWE